MPESNQQKPLPVRSMPTGQLADVIREALPKTHHPQPEKCAIGSCRPLAALVELERRAHGL